MSGVLHIISGLGTGGAEAFLSRLAPALAARNLPQTIVSLTGNGPMGVALTKAGIPPICLDIRSPTRLVANISALHRAIALQAPDVIQGWMYHGDLAAMMVQRTFAPASRLFWSIRCSDMNLQHYSRQLRLTVRACIKASGKPDMIIANSHAGAMVHTAAGYRAKRLEVIYNGVDFTAFAPDPALRQQVRAELGIAPDAIVAVQVARVDPMKDHANFLAALERQPAITGLLIGLGTDALARRGVLGLGRRDDVARLLNACDIIVSPSAFGEGFPNALAEGMSMGLIPIATDVGDSRPLVGTTGLIIPPARADLLAEALGKLAALSPEERRIQGQEARQRICTDFTQEAAVDRFEALYRS